MEKRDDEARLGVELAMQWTEATDDLIKSYVNSVPTPDGGTHDAGLRSAIVKAIRNYIATHKLDPKGVTLTAEDIREGVVAVLSTYVHDPQFQSQTKNRLNNPEVANQVENLVRPAPENFLNGNPNWAQACVRRTIIAGRAMLRFGSRPVVLAGTGLLVAGTALLTQAGPIDALWYAALGAAVTGLGMGLTTTPLLVSIQTVVSWAQRGQATGLVQFSRTIGGAVGTGLMGAILASAVGPQASAILDPVRRGSVPAAELAGIRDALAGGLGLIFLILLVTAMAGFVLALRFMPAVHVDDAQPRAAASPVAD
jgi:hypothetical protein